jgi:hypothetical protein
MELLVCLMRNQRPRALIVSVSVVLSLFSAESVEARTLSSQVETLDKLPTLHPEYPVPSEPNQLFYIQRSVNANTVVYTANLDDRSQLDRDEPVNAYWRWYNVDGHKKSLNFLERTMAFGVRTFSGDPQARGIGIKLVALPERKLTVDQDEEGKPEALLQIGDRLARLVYVYLQVDDQGFMPSVTAIDILGIDKLTGKALREHIVQK